jgi:hypothetical protein
MLHLGKITIHYNDEGKKTDGNVDERHDQNTILNVEQNILHFWHGPNSEDENHNS